MKIRKWSWVQAVAGLALGSLVWVGVSACDSQLAVEEGTSDSGDLTGASEFDNTEWLLAELEANAELCLDDFQACVEGGTSPPECADLLGDCAPPPPPDGAGGGPGGGQMGPPPQGQQGPGSGPPGQGGKAGPPKGQCKPPMGPPPNGSQGAAPGDGMQPPGGPDAGEGEGPPPCPPPVPKELLKPCMDAAKACVEDGGDPEECKEAAHECVRAAADAFFAAKCEEATAGCEAGEIPEEACAHIAEKCAALPAP